FADGPVAVGCDAASGLIVAARFWSAQNASTDVSLPRRSPLAHGRLPSKWFASTHPPYGTSMPQSGRRPQHHSRHFDGLPMTFAVGTRVTSRPPHRSVRAQFGHTAPTLGVLRRVVIFSRNSVCAPAPVKRSPGTVPGPCFADAHSPRPPPLAPPTPQPVARPCSSASQLLWRGQTSHDRTSSATAPRLPDTDQCSTHAGAGRPRSEERRV